MQIEMGPGSITGVATRARGRAGDQLRPLRCERGVLHRADGSAAWAQAGSSVMAAVYGPRMAAAQKEDAERAIVEVVFKPRAGLQGLQAREYEHIIRRTLEGIIQLALHPRTSFLIVLQVLSEDGALLSCALNAACTAMVDAGVPMTKMLGSITAVVTAQGDILVDPDDQEEQAAAAVLSFTFNYAYRLKSAATGSSKDSAVGALEIGDGLLNCYSHGKFSIDHYFDAWTACLLGCEQVAQFSRLSLSKGLEAVK